VTSRLHLWREACNWLRASFPSTLEMTMKTLVALVSLALLAACGGKDPVSYSAPVGISLPVASKDASTGAIAVGKNINTESGNPYGAFVNAARARIGHDPSRIALAAITLQLLTGTSTGVNKLEEVFTGPVAISFEMNGTNAIYPVAQIANPSGAGPVSMSAGFDSSSLPAADRASLDQGQFKVVLSGTPPGGATGAFATGSDLADLVATFQFVAYE
jgi:hypothetical protein